MKHRDTTLLFAVAAFGALVWFGARLAPGLTLGPWQGPLLAGHPLYPAPLVTQWLCDVAQSIPWGATLWKLNFVSACAGAMACGALAAITAAALGPFSSRLAGALAGLFAAASFAALPEVLYESTGAGPAMVTAGLGLGAILMILTASAEKNTLRLPLMGLLAGLAAANHPAMGILAVLLLFGITFSPETASARAWGKGLALFGLGFILAATIPLVHALAAGENLRQFLAHALQTPHPDIGDGMPQWKFARELVPGAPVLLLLLAALGSVQVLNRSLRGPVLLLMSVFLSMGPFLPFLTHQLVAENVHEPMAPRMLVWAAVCGLGAIALAAAGAWFLRRRRWGRTLAAVLLLAAGAGLVAQWPPLPDRRNGLGQELADGMVGAPETQRVYVCGDRTLASLILASTNRQAQKVFVVPAGALIDSGQREKLDRYFEGSVALAPAFPDARAANRWQKQLPFHWWGLAGRETPVDTSQLLDFALWDFTMASRELWPVTFVGLSTPWMTARACRRGLSLVYPEDVLRDDNSPALGSRHESGDPKSAPALAALAAPLSENARRQTRLDTAEHLAQGVLDESPDESAAVIALLRAQARGGHREALLEGLDRYLPRLDDSLKTALHDTLTLDLERHSEEATLNTFLSSNDLARTDPEVREQMFRSLWEADELELLAHAYEHILEKSPEDLDALYQSAAVQAQLARWSRAEESLNRWAQGNEMSGGELARALEQDGRFVPLLVYRGLGKHEP